MALWEIALARRERMHIALYEKEFTNGTSYLQGPQDPAREIHQGRLVLRVKRQYNDAGMLIWKVGLNVRKIWLAGGGDMKIVQQSGGSEMNHWETGKAYWLPATEPGKMHADVNAGSKAIGVMVVELKKAQ